MNIAEKKKNKGEKMGLLPWGMRHEFKNEDMEVKSGSMSVSGDEFEWVQRERKVVRTKDG